MYIQARTRTHTHTVVLLLPILKVVGSNLVRVTSYPCDDLLELPQSLQGSSGTVHHIRPGFPPQPLRSLFDTIRFEVLAVALNKILSSE
jgi:hypothetical protein